VSSEVRARIKRFLKRVIIIGLSCVLGVTALAYVVDYAVFRYRVARNRQPYGQITVTSYDAVPQKNGKTEFIFDPPQVQTCVNALFPRSGYVPCWYLQRHTEPRTNI
jgi:DNA-binding Lrp family transcriptional regulator